MNLSPVSNTECLTQEYLDKNLELISGLISCIKRLELIRYLEKETKKSILGNKELEDFAIKVYNIGLRNGMPYC